VWGGMVGGRRRVSDWRHGREVGRDGVWSEGKEGREGEGVSTEGRDGWLNG